MRGVIRKKAQMRERREQFEVSIRCYRERLLGKASGQCVGGAC